MKTIILNRSTETDEPLLKNLLVDKLDWQLQERRHGKNRDVYGGWSVA